MNEIRKNKKNIKKERNVLLSERLAYARDVKSRLEQTLTSTPPMKMSLKRDFDVKPSDLSPVRIGTPIKFRSNKPTVGYSSRGYKYKVSDKNIGFNPFSVRVLQNLGVLQEFLNVCSSHGHSCKGELFFKGNATKSKHASFSSTLFAVYEIGCSACEMEYFIENDFFQTIPDPLDLQTCNSHATILTAAASKDMSFSRTDQEMLARVQGMEQYFSAERFKLLREEQGTILLTMTQTVIEQNLELEKKLVREGKGLPQNPSTRAKRFEEHEIDSMKGNELAGLLEECGFPKMKLVDQRKEIVKLLLCETPEECYLKIIQKYGESLVVYRIQVGADASWIIRAYQNASRSPFGQAALIGACSRLVIAWSYRIMKCLACTRAQLSGKTAPPHQCWINHTGTVKSMESEMILEMCQSLLSRGIVVSEIALDGDSTTYSLLQQELVRDPLQRLYGGESVVDMKADDRHLKKCLKDHLYNAMNENLQDFPGIRAKVKPMKEPYDPYYLSGLPNLLKCQLQKAAQIPFHRKVEIFIQQVNNISAHYFNDDPAVHGSCLHVGFFKCEVQQANMHNALSVLSCVPVLREAESFVSIISCIGDFLGFEGECQRCMGLITLTNVRPKLADNMWLGERCADDKSRMKFRAAIESVFNNVCNVETAKKILRVNDTQVNESLHGNQALKYRKDVNHGDSLEYIFGMAAGVCRMSLGSKFLPTFLKALKCALPTSGLRYFDKRAGDFHRATIYKSSQRGKKMRGKQQKLLNKILHPTQEQENQQPGTYVCHGGALFAAKKVSDQNL